MKVKFEFAHIRYTPFSVRSEYNKIVDDLNKKTRTHKLLWNYPSVITRCRIYIDDSFVSEGHAFCSPDDNFCKKTGRDKSKGRALQSLFHSNRDLYLKVMKQ